MNSSLRAVAAVPATSANLGPGFDILGIALELQNEVEAITTDEPGIGLDAGAGAPSELCDPANNLVVTAYRSTCDALGIASDGVMLRCVNRIPMRRGLGSSAAAALGGTLVACALHGAPWDEHRILDHVTTFEEGAADNAAAALLGGLVICADGVRVRRLDVPETLRAVLFVPEMELPTAVARAVLPDGYSRTDAVYNAGRCALLVHAIATSDWEELSDAMDDRWHQPQRTALLPWLPDIIASAREGGARGAALSGAGPSVIALTDRDSDVVQTAMMATARRHGLRGRTWVSGIRNWGARIEVYPA